MTARVDDPSGKEAPASSSGGEHRLTLTTNEERPQPVYVAPNATTARAYKKYRTHTFFKRVVVDLDAISDDPGPLVPPLPAASSSSHPADSPNLTAPSVMTGATSAVAIALSTTDNKRARHDASDDDEHASKKIMTTSQFADGLRERDCKPRVLRRIRHDRNNAMVKWEFAEPPQAPSLAFLTSSTSSSTARPPSPTATPHTPVFPSTAFPEEVMDGLGPLALCNVYLDSAMLKDRDDDDDDDDDDDKERAATPDSIDHLGGDDGDEMRDVEQEEHARDGESSGDSSVQSEAAHESGGEVAQAFEGHVYGNAGAADDAQHDDDDELEHVPEDASTVSEQHDDRGMDQHVAADDPNGDQPDLGRFQQLREGMSHALDFYDDKGTVQRVADDDLRPYGSYDPEDEASRDTRGEEERDRLDSSDADNIHLNLDPVKVADLLAGCDAIVHVVIDGAGEGKIDLWFESEEDEHWVAFLDCTTTVFAHPASLDELARIPFVTFGDRLGPSHLSALPSLLHLRATNVRLMLSPSAPLASQWGQALIALPCVERIVLVGPPGKLPFILHWRSAVQLLGTVLQHDANKTRIGQHDVDIEGASAHLRQMQKCGRFER